MSKRAEKPKVDRGGEQVILCHTNGVLREWLPPLRGRGALDTCSAVAERAENQNEKLMEGERLQREYTALPKPTALLITPQERQRILALAQNVPAMWSEPTTSQAERKQRLGYLIKDVTLTKREPEETARVAHAAYPKGNLYMLPTIL